MKCRELIEILEELAPVSLACDWDLSLIHICFFIGRNARVRYVEKHYGEGDGKGKRILNPTTEVTMEEGSSLEMETVQIKGVDSTIRKTVADLAAGAGIVIKERLLTHGNQDAESSIIVNLNGEDASANVMSRSVARCV